VALKASTIELIDNDIYNATFTANEMGALSVPRIPEVLAGTLKSS